MGPSSPGQGRACDFMSLSAGGCHDIGLLAACYMLCCQMLVTPEASLLPRALRPHLLSVTSILEVTTGSP